MSTFEIKVLNVIALNVTIDICVLDTGFYIQIILYIFVSDITEINVIRTFPLVVSTVLSLGHIAKIHHLKTKQYCYHTVICYCDYEYEPLYTLTWVNDMHTSPHGSLILDVWYSTKNHSGNMSKFITAVLLHLTIRCIRQHITVLLNTLYLLISMFIIQNTFTRI